MKTHHTHESRFVLPALIVLLVVVGTHAYFSAHKSRMHFSNLPQRGNSSVANVSYSGKAPQGFLQGFPLEEENIKESYKAVEFNTHEEQYTISYTSAKSAEMLGNMNLDFLKKDGFESEKSIMNGSVVVVSGKKQQQTISIVISHFENRSLVQINFIKKTT